MLVLTRRVGETIVVGENIRITVLGVAGGQVRIGTSAPKDIAVNRAELLEPGRATQSARDLRTEGDNFAPTPAGTP
jgi:carbon storage regulator